MYTTSKSKFNLKSTNFNIEVASFYIEETCCLNIKVSDDNIEVLEFAIEETSILNTSISKLNFKIEGVARFQMMLFWVS